MEWFKTQAIKIFMIICVLETAALIALLLGKGIAIDRHVENHQHQEQFQGQVQITIVPNSVYYKGKIVYTEVCSEDSKSVVDILNFLSPEKALFAKISNEKCVLVPELYQEKK